MDLMDIINDEGSTADLIARLARLTAEPRPLREEDPYLVTNADGTQRVVSLCTDQIRYIQGSPPLRPKGFASFYTPEAFCEYIRRFYSDDQLGIYFDESNLTYKAVLNEHTAGYPDQDRYFSQSSIDLGWSDFGCYLRLKRSPQFAAWRSIHRKPLTQAEFADFIEDHIVDIVEPSGAEMLEIAQSISATTSASFNSSVRLQDGSASFQYHEDVQTMAKGGTLKVPGSFALGIPVFDGTNSYKIPVRLRTRISNAKLSITPIIDQMQQLERDGIGNVSAFITADLTRSLGHAEPPASVRIMPGHPIEPAEEISPLSLL